MESIWRISKQFGEFSKMYETLLLSSRLFLPSLHSVSILPPSLPSVNISFHTLNPLSTSSWRWKSRSIPPTSAFLSAPSLPPQGPSPLPPSPLRLSLLLCISASSSLSRNLDSLPHLTCLPDFYFQVEFLAGIFRALPPRLDGAIVDIIQHTERLRPSAASAVYSPIPPILPVPPPLLQMWIFMIALIIF